MSYVVKFRALALAGFFGMSLTVGISAQERIVLTTPLPAPAPIPAISDYTPGELRIALVPSPAITVVIVGTDGAAQTFAYPCSTGCAYDTAAKVQTLINALNTVNLTTRSLWRRIFDRLVADFPERFSGGATVQ